MGRSAAEGIVEKLNLIMKSLPLVQAIMNERYAGALECLERGGRWSVMPKRFCFRRGVLYGQVRLVSTDNADYRKMFGVQKGEVR